MTEAGASGLPLVASSLGGNADLVQEGETGFLFAPDDVEAQTRAMPALARNETLRRQMGAASREIAYQCGFRPCSPGGWSA